MTFLYNHELIGDFRARSAWEGQGERWLEDELEPAVQDMMRGFKSRLQFYSCVKHFDQAKIDRQRPVRNAYTYFWKLGKSVKYGWIDRNQHENKTFVDKTIRLQKALDELGNRMGDN